MFNKRKKSPPEADQPRAEKKQSSGQVMIGVVLMFIVISLVSVMGLSTSVYRGISIIKNKSTSISSYFTAESVLEDVLYRIMNNIPISENETIVLNDGFATATIITTGRTRSIESIGDNLNSIKKIKVSLTERTGTSFNYGVQAGQGGMNLAGSSRINGNVYSNGPIRGNGAAVITGTAISAGENGLIEGTSHSEWFQFHVGEVSGSAQAHTVNYTNATGNIYCQTGTGNNKPCTSQTDPINIDFPISEADIAGWKNDALAGGVYNGSYSIGTWPTQYVTLGPKKIIGNLTVNGGGILTVSGTLWVTGNISVSGGGTIKLASSYGTNDGVLIADGNISFSGGGRAVGSGTVGNYIMMLSTHSGGDAISLSGGAGAVIAYAPFGTISISGGTSLVEATAYRISLSGGSSITYEAGLIDSNFSSGPAGGFSIDEWEEVE